MHWILQRQLLVRKPRMRQGLDSSRSFLALFAQKEPQQVLWLRRALVKVKLDVLQIAKTIVVHNVLVVFSIEEVLKRQDAVEDRSYAKQIRLHVEAFVLQSLRRNIARSTAQNLSKRIQGSFCWVIRDCETEVSYLYLEDPFLLRAKQNVLWLQISMNDPLSPNEV